MKTATRSALLAAAAVGVLQATFAAAQQTPATNPNDRPTDVVRPAPGFGGPGGFGGGPGGPMGEKRKLLQQFDADKDGKLNRAERDAARAFVKANPSRGPGGPGGFGGRGGGPGMMLAAQIMEQADKDGDKKLTTDEFLALADAWFDRLDPDKTGKVDSQQFADRFSQLMPLPQGRGPGGGGPPDGGPRGGGFGPGRFIAETLFTAADGDKDGSMSRDELKATFKKWFDGWDADKTGSIGVDKLRDGLGSVFPRPQFGGPGGGPGFGRRENREPPKPGAKVSPTDVKEYADAPLYDPTVMRTLFINFDDADWEAELSELRSSDVDVPATLIVDGRTYPNVGVHFRGMSSLMGVGDGFKRSLNISMDFADKSQRLYGYHTLNLLNSHEDPTFLHTILFSTIARSYIPAPKANFVKVIINGENWGVYVNTEQFNKDMLKEWFPKSEGARWKVRGSPGGRGGLEYLGEDAEAYKRIYSIKSKDDPASWKALIKLCKTLNETPPDQLEAALAPMLDVDGALWFLAIENVLINGDGYWIRASDYTMFLDDQGKFHIIPHDMNEVFGPSMGPGGPGGRGGPRGGGPGGGFGGPGGPPPDGAGGPPDGPRGFGGPGRGPGGGGQVGVKLDPLVGLDDATKALRSKLLASPTLKAKYLAHVRTLAEQWLDWGKLQPIVHAYHTMIDEDVKNDTRKLESYEAFTAALSEEPAKPQADDQAGGRGRQEMSLRSFVEQRRAFLLSHTALNKPE